MKCFTVQCLVLTSCCSFTLAQSPVNLGTIQVSHLGHTFVTQSPPFPNLAIDYFIDQAQQSGGGSTLPQVAVDWSINNTFVLTIVAPLGQMFLIQPSMVQAGKFSGFLIWTNGSSGFSSYSSVAIGLTNLQGVRPDFSQSFSILTDSQMAFGFGNIDSAPFTKEIAFTSVVITGTTAQSPASGALQYSPDPASSFAFISATSKSNDPGPCVSIVPFAFRVQSPLDIAPGIHFTNDAAGNFAVTYVGTLQSSSEPGGPFADVPGHPLAAFVVPKAFQNSHQFFRSRYSH